MSALLLLSLSALGVIQNGGGPDPACADEVHATEAVYRLSDLPPEIRDDLRRITNNGMAETRDSPLLQTDAPGEAESDYHLTRFVQALLVRDMWFVQFDVSQFAGVRTIGYFRTGRGPFHSSPSHYFGGPACETIKAALNGVYTPGGFNF